MYRARHAVRGKTVFGLPLLERLFGVRPELAIGLDAELRLEPAHRFPRETFLNRHEFLLIGCLHELL